MNSELFQISEEQAVHLMQLRLPDMMDSMEIDRLIDDVLQSISSKAQSPWVIDLSEVQYMGSSMLGLMVNIRERVRQAGGRIVLCGLSPQLLQIFHTCCLERLFTIAKTRPEAISLAHK